MFGIQESGTQPTDSDDPVLQTRLGIAALAGENRDGWTGTALSERVTEVVEIRERRRNIHLAECPGTAPPAL